MKRTTHMQSATLSASFSDTQALARHRLLWRWHFYAGLFVMPFLLVLAITGTLYCFQPQIEPLLYHDRMIVDARAEPRLSQEVLLAKATAAEPRSATPATVVVNNDPRRSAEFVFKLESGTSESVFIDPYSGAVLGRLSVENRLMKQIRNVHRGLLLGKTGEIVMELAGCWTLVMIATGVALWWPKETINKMNRISRQILQETGLEPDPATLAEKMEMPEDKIRKIMKIAKEPISMETPIGDDDDSHLGDFIEDSNTVAPADAALHSGMRDIVKDVLDSLTPREAKVLRMRFGIEMSTDHTLEEVGKQFDVTRERIRQIEAKGWRKLRHPSRSDKLKSFLEGN